MAYSDNLVELFLQKNISDLPISETNKELSRKMGYLKIADLVHDGWTGMCRKEGFCSRWFMDITDVFEKEGFLQLLEGRCQR